MATAHPFTKLYSVNFKFLEFLDLKSIGAALGVTFSQNLLLNLPAHGVIDSGGIASLICFDSKHSEPPL